MTEDEKMKLIQEGMRIGKEHRTPSPETAVKIAVLDEKLNAIDSTLESILAEMNSTKKWIMASLFSMLLSVGGIALWIGDWKGTMNEKVSNLEKHQSLLEYKIDSHIDKSQK